MKHILIGAFLLAQITTSFSQDPNVVYVQTNRRPQRELKVVDLYSVYKFDFTAMVTGQYKFGIEQRISDKSSVEFELGATLSEIGIFNDHSKLYASPSSGTKTVSKFGLTTSLAWRYYPLDEVPAFNKFYVSPKISFRNYNTGYEMNPDFSYGATADPQTGHKNMTRFMMMLGKQYWLSSTFCLDVYAGLGLGNTTTSYYSIYSEYDYTTQTYKPITKRYSESNNSVVFECGLKLGIGK